MKNNSLPQLSAIDPAGHDTLLATTQTSNAARSIITNWLETSRRYLELSGGRQDTVVISGPVVKEWPKIAVSRIRGPAASLVTGGMMDCWGRPERFSALLDNLF